LAKTLSYSISLALTGLTFSIEVRVRLFNIWSEGRVYIGTVAAVAIGILFPLEFCTPWL
jgi:nucleoside ABC transporter membrane protein